MTEWIRQKAPIKEANVKPTSAAYRILSDAGIINRRQGKEAADSPADVDMANASEGIDASGGVAKEEKEGIEAEEVPTTEAMLRKTLVFDDALARLGRQGRQNGGKKVVRYQQNPERNWGPLTRASAQ
jgi:tRNA (guanine26-N2/guanine27-N2)-dimethyltransferase